MYTEALDRSANLSVCLSYLHKCSYGLGSSFSWLVAGPPSNLRDQESTRGLSEPGRILELGRDHVRSHWSENLNKKMEL